MAKSESEKKRKFTLDQFLKIEGWVGTGGEAKVAIQDGKVHVNGVIETRRRRQLVVGDEIKFGTSVGRVSEPGK